MSEPRATGLRRAVLGAALVAALLGLAVRGAVLARGRDLGPDGCVDLTMARELLEGRTHDALARKFHPLAPVLEVGLARALGREPDESVGHVAALAAGALVPFAVALAAAWLALAAGGAARALSPARAALAAGLLAAAHPHLAEAAATVDSRPLAHAALALALAAALATAVGGRARAGLAAGLAAGLGYLARPDGLALLVGVVAGLAAAGLATAGLATVGLARRKLAALALDVALVVALVLVGFALPASGYVLALHDLTGEWRLTLKKDVRHLAGEPDPRGAGVAPVASGLTVAVARAERPDDEAPGPGAAKGTSLVSAVGYTLRKTSEAVHPLVLGLALVGVVGAWAARRALLVPGAILGAYVPVHVLLRAHEGYLSTQHATGEASLVLAPAGLGVLVLGEALGRRAPRLGPTRATAGLALLASLALLPQALSGHAPVKAAVQRAAAAWIREHAPPGRELVVAGESAWPVAFLAGARYLGSPAGDARDAARTARQAGASFLVVHVRSHGATDDAVPRVRAAVEEGGLAPPVSFREERPDAASGGIVYTWLVYPLSGGNQ